MLKSAAPQAPGTSNRMVFSTLTAFGSGLEFGHICAMFPQASAGAAQDPWTGNHGGLSYSEHASQV